MSPDRPASPVRGFTSEGHQPIHGELHQRSLPVGIEPNVEIRRRAAARFRRPTPSWPPLGRQARSVARRQRPLDRPMAQGARRPVAGTGELWGRPHRSRARPTDRDRPQRRRGLFRAVGRTSSVVQRRRRLQELATEDPHSRRQRWGLLNGTMGG